MRMTALLLTLLCATPALALPICGSGKRVNCIVDGDTWWSAGVKYRHATINTPEVSKRHAKCQLEIRRGKQATRRLQELTARGFRIQPTGRKGRYGRALATIILPDGREAGAVLVSEGLAKWYRAPGWKEWCGRGRGFVLSCSNSASTSKADSAVYGISLHQYWLYFLF